MQSICKACGSPISNQFDEICESCQVEFKNIESDIKMSEDSKYLRYCKYCGRPFTAVKIVTYSKTGTKAKRGTNRLVCGEHYAPCLHCGKPIKFSGDGSFIPTTCSKDCRKVIQSKHYHETCLNRYGADSIMQVPEFVDRRKQNNLEKYGVDNPAKLDSVKEKYKQTCLERFGCTSTFQSKTAREKSEKTMLARYGTTDLSSIEDIKEKRKHTNLEKYGVDNPMKSPEVVSKLRQTNLELYGTEYSIMSETVQAKIKETNLDRYGVEYPFQNSSIRSKRVGTWRENYGADHPLKNPEVHRKQMDTSVQRYGGVGNASPELLNKYKETCLERYGVDNPNKCDSIQEEKRETCRSKYGVDHPMKTPEIKDKARWSRILSYADTISDETQRANYLEFCENPREYILNHFEHKPSIVELSETFGGLDPTSVSMRIPMQDHELLGRYQTSMEREVSNFLRTIIPTLDMIVHDRVSIKPYELDIYLPEYKLAIECNPTATHNSTYNCFSSEESPLSSNYHKLKSEKCLDAGIQLFHIFGYEWTLRRPVIESMIINLLHKSNHRYYARKLQIAELNYAESVEFFNANHLQGSMSGSIRIGLKTEQNELVAAMIFNKIRHTMGRTHTNFNTWELSRFCSKLNTTVVGGASKLFRYFIKKYNPNSIISFSDIAHTTGNLYKQLGFINESISDPGYVWVNLKSDIYYSRVACQKRNLAKLLGQDIDLENKTEKMIMSEHGYVQVFDSGKIKWVWNASL